MQYSETPRNEYLLIMDTFNKQTIIWELRHYYYFPIEKILIMEQLKYWTLLEHLSFRYRLFST